MSNHKRKFAGRGRVDPAVRPLLERTEQAVERAKKTTLSQQPRFDGKNPQSVWSSTYRWVVRAELDEPPYQPQSIRRDQWLRAFWRAEPHLAGVLNSVIAIDKNRGWTITGGRNQVLRYTDILHRAEAAPGLSGWRNFLSAQALSFYGTDLGTVCEMGTEGRAGPLRALYHVDSARCQLTGRADTPLQYNAGTVADVSVGLGTPWNATDFFRVVSMPSDDELMRGLGFCAVSRCLELAKLMVAVYRHDAEVLGSRMPEGLLLLQNITQEQWDDAMAVREADLNAKGREKFGGVYVLATAGIDQVDAKLVALSNLPAEFDMQTFTDQLMFGYALALGYSPREFWPVSSGALGTATESQTQDDNSTGKGERDFSLNYQEQLAEQLPPALLFEFDERDAKGDLDIAAIEQAKANIIQVKAAWNVGGVPVLTADQVLQLAVEQELIPPEWTALEEDIVASDTDNQDVAGLRARLREHASVRRAIEQFPDEPIVRYKYPSGRLVTLWESGDQAVRRTVYPAATAPGRDFRRLLSAIERAIEQLAAQPAGAAAPVVLVQGPDGALSLLPQPQPPAPLPAPEPPPPPVVNVSVAAPPPAEVHIDNSEVARAIERSAPDWAAFARALVAGLPQPQTVDVEAIIRAFPAPAAAEPFDYQQFAQALADSLANLTLPAPVVNLSMPEPPKPEVVIAKPQAEKATFTVHHDSQGRIDEVVKTVGR